MYERSDVPRKWSDQAKHAQGLYEQLITKSAQERYGPLETATPGEMGQRMREAMQNIYLTHKETPFSISELPTHLIIREEASEHAGLDAGEVKQWAREAREAETEYLVREGRSFTGRIEDVREDTGELRESGDADFADGIASKCDYLLTRLPVLAYGTGSPQANAAFDLLATLEVAIKNAKAAQDLQDSTAPVSRHASLIRRLFKKLVEAREHLWNLVRGHLNVLEWTLHGEIDVGIFAKGGMDIKFGPSTEARLPGVAEA